MRTALVENATDADSWMLLSASAAMTAMTAAAMQAVKNTRMVNSSVKLNSF
jgi:hypothetical protein